MRHPTNREHRAYGTTRIAMAVPQDSANQAQEQASPTNRERRAYGTTRIAMAVP